MPLYDDAAKNESLDADYGSGVPASWTVRLFEDDPRAGAAEIVGGGYAAQTVTNNAANFPAAANGVKTSAPVDFGTASGDWPTARWWQVEDAATGVAYECAELDEPTDVLTGNGVQITLTISYDPEA